MSKYTCVYSTVHNKSSCLLHVIYVFCFQDDSSRLLTLKGLSAIPESSGIFLFYFFLFPVSKTYQDDCKLMIVFTRKNFSVTPLLYSI